MGGDLEDMGAGYGSIVSIHAPAWGATFAGSNGASIRSVSIHAPAWGATIDQGGGNG